MTRIIKCTLLTLLFCSCLPALSGAASRIWTDSQGRKVTAELDRMEGDQVVLKDAGGRTMTIPISTLSSADQTFLKGDTKPDSAKPAPDKPDAPAAPNPDLPFPRGKPSEEVSVEKAEGAGYRVYLPKAFSLDRKWPALFIFTAHGGDVSHFKPFKKSAEELGWVLIVATRATTNIEENTPRAIALIEDVGKRLPLDPKQIYYHGSMGGAVLCQTLLQEHRRVKPAGLLLTDHADPRIKISGGMPVYLIIGTSSPARYNIAQVYDDLRHKDSRLVLLDSGKHARLKDELDEALLWLHTSTIKSNARHPDFAPKAVALSEQLLTRAEAGLEGEPEWVADWQEHITALSTSPKTRPRAAKLKQALLKNEKAQLHLKVKKDLDRFTEKCLLKKAPKKQEDLYEKDDKLVREADKYIEKYNTSPKANIFKRLGEPPEK